MRPNVLFFFFFNDTATTEIYTLSLHDALPICLLRGRLGRVHRQQRRIADEVLGVLGDDLGETRSEEHTSELQSQSNLVCRLLLEKKKKNRTDLLYCLIGRHVHTLQLWSTTSAT